MFVHGGWAHILFNMFALFMFGPILEYAIGPKKFFNLYFICGIGAALIQMLAQAVEVHMASGAFTTSGGMELINQAGYDKVAAICTLRMQRLAHQALFSAWCGAFAMLYPDMELMLLFVPVPIKAKYLIPVYIVIELVSGFGQFTGDNVAHFAHLGGALLGFLLIKIWRYR